MWHLVKGLCEIHDDHICLSVYQLANLHSDTLRDLAPLHTCRLPLKFAGIASVPGALPDDSC